MDVHGSAAWNWPRTLIFHPALLTLSTLGQLLSVSHVSRPCSAGLLHVAPPVSLRAVVSLILAVMPRSEQLWASSCASPIWRSSRSVCRTRSPRSPQPLPPLLQRTRRPSPKSCRPGALGYSSSRTTALVAVSARATAFAQGAAHGNFSG